MLCVAHRTPPTVSAIQALIRAGADMFEVDVRVDAGQLIASHFLPTFSLPLLGVPALLERDNRRIRRRRALSPDPTLTETISRIPQPTRVLLDPKDKDPARRAELVGLLLELPQRSRFCVSTPYTDDLAALRSAGYQTWRTVDNALQLQELLAEPNFDDAGVSIRHRLIDPTSIDALRNRTPTVIAWTVNDVRTADRLQRLGVAGITTDRDDVIRSLRR